MKKTLSRRTFLRGTGVALALPYLEAMGAREALAAGGDADNPRRFVAFYVPNGFNMPEWTPVGTGTNYTLSYSLEPLSPVKSEMLVLSGLANLPAKPEQAGDHAGGTGAFLTCTHVKKTDGPDIQSSVSADQLLAQHLGQWTPFPSLELGIEGGGSSGGCDSGYSCAYSRNIAWSDPTTWVPKETNPKLVFERLFANADASLSLAEIERRRMYRTSILDWVREDALRLRKRLGVADRLELDRYQESIFSLETQLAALESQPTCAPGVAPQSSLPYGAHVKAMMDLIVLAFRCDLTRVVTFMLGNAGSNRVYSSLGIADGHHYLSHHAGDPAKLSQLREIDRWEMSQLSYLLTELAAVQEGEGTLLDHSLVFMSSEISDGQTHKHTDMPVVLAGRGCEGIVPGRHVVSGAEPMANLFVSVLNGFGVPAESFGDDGDGPLSGLS